MKDIKKYNDRKTRFKKGMVVLFAMVKKNIKNQYRRSVLGILWTVLNPLLTMIVLAFVFSSVFGRKGVDMDYSVYVLSGNIVFSLMRSATTMALPSMVNNYDLFTKTKVLFSAFPTASVCTAVVNFAFSIIALVAVMLFRLKNGIAFHATLLMIAFPWLPAIFLFCLGLALILCSVYVRFRDIQHLYSVFLTLWMYMTPIFYSLQTINNDKAQKILVFNPMLHYLSYFRELIMGTVPSWQEHVYIYGFGLCAFIIGLMVFRSQKKKFVLYN